MEEYVQQAWDFAKQVMWELGVQEVYMLLNVVCLMMFVYHLVRFAMGHPLPEPKKPDPTLIPSYWFSHWWINILLAYAWIARRFFCTTIFPLPKEKLLDLLKDTPKEAEAFFGDQAATVAVYETVIADLEKSPLLSNFGRFTAQRQLLEALRARQAFMKYFVAHPEIADVSLPSPIVITGLPRTGSTLLHNLLACDPAARAPFNYEVDAGGYDAIAPPSKAMDTEHLWFQRGVHAWDARYRLTPEIFADIAACHFSTPETIADDAVLIEHALPPLKYIAVLSNKARRMLLTATNKRNVYLYLYRYYQLLQSGQPDGPTHWVLKSPFHASHLPLLRATFPGARIVMLHREMKQVVASSATKLLREMHPSLKGKGLDKKLIGRLATELCSETTNALLARKALDVTNLQYDEWIADPIGTVKALYDQWGMEVSDDFENKMREYLEKNPKGKYGEVKYTVEEYGLSGAVLDCTFGKYAAMQAAQSRDGPEITSPRHSDQVHVPSTA
ncbi:hypothetical protein SDRG_07857 [Saprolegnia diclina VS20]|uniref:Sulfotransferase domain-containing protein n=1 Tax=Saprolegnia diclina (strain VS20) TaxID=1156394 RepID=T0Q9H4_SAPDV|nr:hypothetical protein SDRG_07857 [Saprolegnia diclina VS20]EQC34529.1 hypothetical protein SDRG_07857 [Saprolegnia diclina VS20]|eukprot:XP_008611935.1 hypothetical protein SDRG_07857 [Saprolegnia diclina VS20]